LSAGPLKGAVGYSNCGARRSPLMGAPHCRQKLVSGNNVAPQELHCKAFIAIFVLRAASVNGALSS
jgi:hypothetical protein